MFDTRQDGNQSRKENLKLGHSLNCLFYASLIPFQVAYRQWVCGTEVRPPSDYDSSHTSKPSSSSSPLPFSGTRDQTQPSRTLHSDSASSSADTLSTSSGLSTPNGATREASNVRPCKQLCNNVELSCPFLNPSITSGGRPAFVCPQTSRNYPQCHHQAYDSCPTKHALNIK